MQTDTLSLQEGSEIVNITVERGTADPANPNDGQLFFRTDLDQLSVYSEAQVAWLPLGQSTPSVSVSEEGVEVLAAPTDINFAGTGVTAVDDLDGTVTVTVETGDGVVSNLSASRLATITDDNNRLINDSANDYTITLPEDATEALPVGFEFMAYRASTGRLIFATEGTDVLEGEGTEIEGAGLAAVVFKRAAGIWSIIGRLV